MDHGSLYLQLNLSASLDRQCFNITITDDDMAEDDEVFYAYISYIRNAAGHVIRYPYRSRTNIIIFDDDCKSLMVALKL